MSNPHVLIETTEGDILVELFADKAPVSVENFLKYVDSGHYEETIFHRVIRDFMIQGGGMTMNMDEKPAGAPIKNEAGNGLKNLTGTLAMARTMVVDSATAQFFINVKDNAFLDHQNESAQGFGYAVFGQVVEGMDVVMKISKRKTKHFKGHDDVPADPVFINKVQRFEV